MNISQLLTKLKTLVYSKSETDSLLGGKASSSHTHTKSQITDFPTIPTVNNAILKIQKNGTDVKTFTANASSDVTCNITVPTKVSELSNDSGFLTSHQSLSNYSTLANTVKSLSISGKTITVTPGSGSAYTLTTQDTTYSHPTSSGNKHIPSGGSSGQFLGWSADGTAKWVNNPNTNTDTLMTQNVSTTNATYPVLLVAAADATANQGAKTGIFAKSVKVNPSTNVISASGFVGPLTGNVTGNCSGSSGSCTGNAANVTGTVAIGHGGTGATTRLGAVQNLTNENVGTSTEYFLTITTNWGKAGYCSVANAKSVLGIPTVNNATLTIQKNGSNVATFTANASSNVTANISVPTKVSQLTNDSGFITSAVGMLEMKGNPPYIDFHASNDATHDYTSRIIDDGTASTGRLRLTAHFNSANYQVELYKNFFEPTDDNDIYLGDSTNRWKNIFCTTDSISTSDLRLKNTITDIDDSLLDAWENIEPKQYKFNDATEEKGDKARYHTGYLAQDIQTECEKQGVNASDYGLFCYDEWDAQEEISEETEKEKDGKIVKEKRIIQPKREKGDRYSLRYAEALVVECKYLRRCIARLTARIEELEKGNNIK